MYEQRDRNREGKTGVNNRVYVPLELGGRSMALREHSIVQSIIMSTLAHPSAPDGTPIALLALPSPLRRPPDFCESAATPIRQLRAQRPFLCIKLGDLTLRLGLFQSLLC